MKYRALISFSGLISMHKGQERFLDDQELIDDLMQAGYIEAAETENKPPINENLLKQTDNDSDDEKNDTESDDNQPTNESNDNQLNDLSVEELVKFASDNGINIGNAKTKNAILKKIEESKAEK